MLKALLKKQLLELNAFYFQDKKTGKNRTRGKTILYIALFGFLFLFLAGTFGTIGYGLALPMVSAGMDWLYFTIMGMLALLLGVFGDVFNTYAGLYHAKDNELLLAMPIPPSRILLMRLIGVYLMGLLYESMVMVPSVVVYWIVKTPTVASVVFPVLLVFILNFLVLTLTCILGWVVALIAARLKNRSIVTVLITLVVLAVYYVFCFRLQSVITSFLQNMEAVGHVVKTYLFPFYHMGLGASGNPVSFLIFTALVAVVSALTCLILSRTFIRIVTSNKGGKKAVYREKRVRASGVQKALLYRELRRFVSSPTYMLNCGLGMVILPALAIFALIRMKDLEGLLEALSAAAPDILGILPVFAVSVICLVLSMNYVTAPSVSLEGKSLWLSQSLPVSGWQALKGKLTLHILLNLLPALIGTFCLGIAFRLEIGITVLIALAAIAYLFLSASAGLIANLKRPNFTWTNESVPVKQGMSVVVTLLGGWALCILLGAGGYFLRFLSPWILLSGELAVLSLAAFLLIVWLKRRGSRLYEKL